MNKQERLFKNLVLNALTINLILLESLTKVIYYRFFTVCKTLNQNWKCFFSLKKHFSSSQTRNHYLVLHFV